jgi:hypothetical protein
MIQHYFFPDYPSWQGRAMPALEADKLEVAALRRLRCVHGVLPG